MSSLKHRLFAAGFAATSALRADRWLRPLAQGCGAILMFHHVRPWRERAFAPNRLLEITPEFLDRALAIAVELGFDLVSLDEVPLRLQRSGRPFAAITFVRSTAAMSPSSTGCAASGSVSTRGSVRNRF